VAGAEDVDHVGNEGISGFATVIPAVAREFDAVRKAAPSPAPLLLLAETGAGKEVIARAIHDLSGRRGAFVAVNCGALSSSMIEALLFGHVRGAFSGAVKDALGLVRAADGGTLFLDEIGDLPASSQPALLRVLQEKEVTPVGSAHVVRVDLRVIAATNRSLPDLASRGEFRQDLLARLDGFTFTLPPLRDRVFDLALLLARILARVKDARIPRLRIAPEAARSLYRHAWPSNIREFEQCVLRALTLSPDEVIGVEQIAFGALADRPIPRSTNPEPNAKELGSLLGAHRGNVAAVARETGKAAVQIRRWMKKFGIDPNDYRA
jgi:transcriptional regulator with GAF, ATPase, and Fis domain